MCPVTTPSGPVSDAMDVTKEMGEGTIVDCSDRGSQDDRTEDVGAVDDGVREDRKASGQLDEGTHQGRSGWASIRCASLSRA